MQSLLAALRPVLLPRIVGATKREEHAPWIKSELRVQVVDDEIIVTRPGSFYDAAPLSVGVPEHSKPCDALGLGVDGPAATLSVFAPMRDQAPLDKVERALACLVVLPDNEQFLARRSIVARAHIAHAAIADIEAIYYGEAKRS